MSIEYIFFDLGVVILDFDHAKGCQQVADVSGCSAEEAQKIIFDSGLEIEYETGLITSQQFHEQFSQASGTDSDLQSFLTACGDIFSLNTPMMPLIGQLSAVGFPMGILSNTCEAHWQHVYNKYPFLRQNYRDYILSYEFKSMKPDPAIYNDAIEAAGLPANQIFFVDDRQENVDGAIDAGIDAVLYESAGQVIGELQNRGIRFNL
jgi:putative hydrolase of the HAD superfamily